AIGMSVRLTSPPTGAIAHDPHYLAPNYSTGQAKLRPIRNHKPSQALSQQNERMPGESWIMTSLLSRVSGAEQSAAAGPRTQPAVVEPFRVQARRRLARTDLLGFLAWVAPVVAVACLLAAGGAGGFSSFAGSATALGIVAGLVGMDVVLLMLLLAARIPLIDNTIGHDRALEI